MATENDVYVGRLLRELGRAGRATALRYRDQSLSGEALLALIFQYARALRDLDVRRGTLLGMFAPNRPEAIAIRYAAHVLGAATVYLSVPPTEGGRQALVDEIAPDLLVVFPETTRYLGQSVGVPVVTAGVDKVGSRGRLDVLAASASTDWIDVSADSNDLAVISSSGGSTGVPKGSCPKLCCVHCHGQRGEPAASHSADKRSARVSFAGPGGYYAAARRPCRFTRGI
jgi:fatty-acyl-CoA synthase